MLFQQTVNFEQIQSNLTPGPASAMDTDAETAVKFRSLYSQIPS